MKAKLSHRMCGVVLGAALCLQASAAMAAIVKTDNLASQHQTATEKSRVQSFVDRAEVQDKLKALGVDQHALAQRIDSMPAGGTLNNNDLILILLIVILVLVI